MANSHFTPQSPEPGRFFRRLYVLSQNEDVRDAGLEVAKSVKKLVDAIRGGLPS